MAAQILIDPKIDRFYPVGGSNGTKEYMVPPFPDVIHQLAFLL